MSWHTSQRSGFVLRLLSLLSFSCMMIFVGIVVLQNQELQKIIPASNARSFGLFFGYVVAIITFDYALAVKGRNFMGWKVEGAIVAGVAMAFAGAFFPFAFPVIESVPSERVYGLLGWAGLEADSIEPNWTLSWLSLLSVPFFIMAFWHLANMQLWRESKASE